MTKPYIDWSKAPEGATHVIYRNKEFTDGIPEYSSYWEKWRDDEIYDWDGKKWDYHCDQHQIVCERIAKADTHLYTTKQEKPTMKLEFVIDKQELEVEQKQLTLNDVEVDQLFITEEGYLCQKISSDRYNILANPDGSLYANHYNFAIPDCVKVKHVLDYTHIKVVTE